MSDDQTAADAVGVSCDSCGWELTIEDVVERERENRDTTPSAQRVRSKFGSLGEGHAYFNRGHRVTAELELSEIESGLADVPAQERDSQ